MALEPTTVSEEITVENPVQELKLAVSSSPPWYTDKEYTITVSYRSDIASETSGSEPFTPTIHIKYSNGNTQTIMASGTMYYGREGTYASATGKWVPSDNYNATITASWEDLISNAEEGEVVAPTTFTGASVSPSKVNPGGAVGVSAYLKYYVNGKWEPLEGAPVTMQVLTTSGKEIGSGVSKTNASGLVQFTLYAPKTPGNYIVKLIFNPKAYGGFGNLAPAEVALSLISGKKTEWVKYVVAIGATAVAGFILYKIIEKHFLNKE